MLQILHSLFTSAPKMQTVVDKQLVLNVQIFAIVRIERRTIIKAMFLQSKPHEESIMTNWNLVESVTKQLENKTSRHQDFILDRGFTRRGR